MAALAFGFALAPQAAQAATVTWTGGGGDSNFNNAANWNTSVVPSAGDDVVIGAGITVNVSSGNTINSLTTGAGTIVNNNSGILTISAGTNGGANAGLLNVSNNTALALNGVFKNTGTVVLNSVGNVTDLQIAGGTLSLTGGGGVTLSDTTANRIYGVGGAAALTNVDNTISGAGEIGSSTGLVINNKAAGVFDANKTNVMLFDGSGAITNQGILRATNTGGLRFIAGNTVDNTGGGRIQANGAGSHVDLQSVTFKGGTLSTSAGGVIQTTSTGTLDGSGSAVTITAGSTVQVSNNMQLNLLGTITNQGTIALASVGNVTDLIASGVVTLNGGGKISLSDAAANRIYGAVAGSVLDNVNNTISGAGQLGVNGALTFKNESVIDASATNALVINAPTPVLNTGTLRSSNTSGGNGGLVLSGTTIDNTGAGNSGLILADGANTHVDINAGTTILGGTLTDKNGGVINVSNSTLDGTTAGAPVHISAGTSVNVANNSSITLKGTIDAQGVIKLNSVGNITDLIIGAGTVTLSGPGGIVTSDNGANRIYGGGGGVLDNLNSTISGAGTIGVLGGWTLKNESLVDANQTNALVINAVVPVQNTGTLRSSNTSVGNGGLVLSGTTIDNTGAGNSGRILADGANTHVDINAATTILGGTLTGKNGGVINVSNSTLDGSGAGAPIHLAGGTTVNIGNNTNIGLNGTIDNKGTIALNSVGNVTDLIAGAAGTKLIGGGVITLSDNIQNRIYSNTAGAVLENVDNTIRGAGQIFPNSGMVLQNDTAGVIDATGINTLTISSFPAANAVRNLGLLETTAGTGGLVFSSSVVDNTGNSNAGRIVADGSGTHVDINFSTILGGTLTAKNGGVFNSNVGILDGSGAGAPIHIASGTTVNVANNTNIGLNGAIDNKGAIALHSGGNVTDLIVGAAGTKLTGGGGITFSDNAQNRIYSNTPGAVLENVDNTISGAGQIFPNSGMVLKNDTAGVINATGANTLTISNFPAFNAVQNLGLLETTAGSGGLVFSNAVVDNTGNSNAGRIVADGSGTHVDINFSTILGGTLTGKNGGVFNSSIGILDGSGAGAPIHIASGTTVNVANNTNITLNGAIDNKGAIALHSGGNVTDLIVGTAGAKLTGGGVVTLSDNIQNRIYSGAATTVLDNVDNTISGAGMLFGMTLKNSGIVDATGANTLTLTLDSTNNAGGILRASGSGGLIYNAGTLTNNGTVEALNGSSFTFNGSAAIANNTGGTLTGGTWRAVSTGGGATVSLVGGPIVTDAANLILDGAGSTIQAGSAGSYTDIQSSLTTIAGTGQLHVLNGQNFTTANNIGNSGLIDLGGGTFTAKNLTNSGTVSGFGTVTPSSGTQVANSGSVIATGGTLAVTTGLAGTGTAQINAGAGLDLSAATTGSTVGTLAHNGTQLALGSHNITVSTDYTNASFGTGNAFNNHAGVTGTGLILASGTGLAMSVSGTGITGGGTATPGLALGSVHVGSPLGGAFDINWAGTGAPSLRGAVQTTAGLSVSAPGFGAILPGGSAHEVVSVAAGAAGSLAGQSLKVVTNFDNVAAKTIAVTGAAYDFANPVVTPPSLSFGNVHVGDVVAQQAVSVQNSVITSAAFQEGLNASIGTSSTGVTTNGGTITNLAAGTSNSTALKVGISTTAAGAISGTAALGLVSNGAGTSGLGLTTLPNQTVAVTGGVYNLAASSVIAPISFGVVHVGSGLVTKTLSITNTAATGAFSEGLNSSFGSLTGTIAPYTATNGGSIVNLAAGATNASAMSLSFNPIVAGSYTGNVVVQQASNGAGTSGLGLTALADQNVGLSAGVTIIATNLAVPVINTAQPVNFGNVRLNAVTAAQTLSITNGAPVGAFTEGLIGSAVGTTGTGILASGGFGVAGNSLQPSQTNPAFPVGTGAGSITVNIDTSSAGAKSGNAVLNFKSDGTPFAGGTITDLGNTNVAVNGAVYRLANPTQNTPSITLAARVGAAAPSAAVSLTNTSPDIYTEGLKASLGAGPAGFTTSGAIGNLAAGATDTSSLQVALNTATSGSFTGSTAVNLTSTGAGTTGAPDLALAPGSVTLNGKVYQTATAAVTPSVNFGIVHVGDVVTAKSINVANAAAGALTDVLTGSIASVTGPFTNGGGTLGAGVVAGSSSNALTVGLNTASAGVFSGGSANLALSSHNADLADVAVATGPVGLSAQVNNYAISAFGKVSGAGSFSGGGTHYTLNFGSVLQGAASLNAALQASNAAIGPADLLDGSFSVFSGSGFGLSGFNPFTNLAAGLSQGGLNVLLSSATIGSFLETIDLTAIGHNASGYSAGVADVFLTLQGNVTGSTGVPEPASWLTLLAGVIGLGTIARRRHRRHLG